MGNSIRIGDPEKFLIEAVVRHIRNGNRVENRFKKATWQFIVTALNEAFSDILEKSITITQAKWKECTVSSNQIDLLLYS